MHCHFHVYAAGRVHLDPDGVEVSDLQSAVVEAREVLAELEVDEGLLGWPGAGGYILVHAVEESIVCVIALDTEPALNGSPSVWDGAPLDSVQTGVTERPQRNRRALQ